MTSSKRAGRITTFGFALGIGMVIASGSGAAVASAAPDESGHSATSSSSASHGSSARANRGPSASPNKSVVRLGAAKTKPVAANGASDPAGATSVSTAVPSRARTLAVVPSVADESTPVTTTKAAPTVAAKQAPARRLPTPTEIQQTIAAGLDGVRRDLDTLRRNIELLVRHQIEGIRDNLTTLRYDLEAIIGPNRPPVTPDIPDAPGVIGNPTAKENLFVQQGQTNRCVLMATAMVIGQLLGADKMPTAEAITNEAATTPSSVTPGAMIYDPVNDTYVKYADALQLLENHGITAISTQYSKGQGGLAYDNVKAALIAGESVIVTVNANIAWGRAAPGDAVTANHAITVLGIDTVNDIVYVNDSAFSRPGIAMKRSLFMSAWAANDFQTITAHVTPAQESTIAA